MADQHIKITVNNLIQANPNLEKVRSKWVNDLGKAQVRIEGQLAEVEEVERNAEGAPTSITVFGPPKVANVRWLVVVVGQDDQIIAVLNYENGEFIFPEDKVPKDELSRAVTTYVVQLVKETIEKERGDLSKLLTTFAQILVDAVREELEKYKPVPTRPGKSPKD